MNGKRLLIVAVGLWLILSMLMAPGNNEVKARAEKRADIGGEDVPVWHIGDKWGYTGTVEMDMQGFELYGVGYANFTMTKFETVDIGEESHRCYYIKVWSEVMFQGSASGNAIIVGDMWYRQSDLANTKYHMNANINATYNYAGYEIPLVGTVDTVITHQPPLEECDFPLNVDETWAVQTHTVSEFEGTGFFKDMFEPHTEEDTSFNYDCVEYIDDYKGYPVYHNSPDVSTMNEVYYSPEVKYYVEMAFDFGGFPFTLELDEYIPSSVTTEVDVDISPSTATFGSQVDVNIDVDGPLGSGLVKVSIPQASDVVYSDTIVGGSTTVTIDVPLARDDTPTDIDEGSFGVVVIVDSVYNGVSILTVTGPDICVRLSDPPEDIIAGDEVDMEIEVINGGTATAGLFYIDLYAEDILVGTTSADSLTEKETITVSITWQPIAPGSYEIKAVANENETVLEVNMVNNTDLTEAEVTANSAPVETNATPVLDTINIKEGEGQDFSFTVVDNDGDPVSYEWRIKDKKSNLIEVVNGSGNEYTFSSNHTGEKSSADSPYTVECTASDGRPPGVEGTKKHSWVLNVANVNLIPEVNDYAPKDDPISVDEGGNVSFFVNATDGDEDTLEYTWMIDGEVNNELEGPSVVITTQYTGSMAAGTYNINLTVSDGTDSLYVEWTLVISDVNRKPSIVSLSPSNGTEYKSGEDIAFKVAATDEDGDGLNYTWVSNKDGKIGEGASITSSLSAGSHTITLTVKDGKGGQTQSQINLEVKKEDGGKKKDSGYEDLTFVVMVALLSAVLIGRYRRRAA